jgi:hypothetical protein
LAWVITIIPIFLHPSVPGVDTPNHLARLQVLATLHERPALQDFYKINFVILPNLAIDLLITPILMLTKINALILMKIFIANMIGLMGFGFAWVNREMTGKWSAYGLFGLCFAYSYILAFGFINYLFGIALGLICFALCLRLDPKPFSQNLFLVVAGPLLALNHLMAFGLFALSFVGHRLFKPDHSFQGWPGLGIGTIIVLVLIKLSPVPQQAEVYWRPFGEHLLRLASPLVFGIEWRDFLFEGVLLALIAYGAYKRSFKIPLEAKATGILFLLISLFAPHQAFTSAFIFTRIPVWLIMIYFASVELPLRRVSVVLTILTLRSLDMGSRFLTMNPDIDQMKADLLQIPAGSLVYNSVAQGSAPMLPRGWNPSLLHADCLLLLEKDVYISNLFTIEAQQPLIDQPGIGLPWRDHYFRVPFESGVLREVEKLRVKLKSLPNESLRSRPAFLLVLKSESQVPPAVPEPPIIARDRYALYRIQ